MTRRVMVLGAMAILISTAGAQPFLFPGLLNPGGGSDALADLQVDHLVDGEGTFHAVWASQVNYSGTAGTDPDIWYSRNPGTGWTAPELVNTYGTLDGGDDERMPRLAITPDGVIHCAWQSNNPYAGAGTDWDIFAARRTAAGWQQTELVNSFATIDQISGGIPPVPPDDTLPSIVADATGRVLAAWQSTASIGPGMTVTGTDGDILYSIRSGSGWSAASWLNSNATTDSGSDRGPVALAVSSDNTFHAVWSTDDDFRVFHPVGPDRDIVWASLPPLGSWSEIGEVAALARTDAGADEMPAVAIIGSGAAQEIHIAWQSTSNLSGSGTDWEILACVKGSIQVLPTLTAAHLVNSTAFTDGTSADTRPVLAVEPGDVVHCVWQSDVDLGLNGTEGDLLHSTNATSGGTWSPAELVNLSGLTVFDGGLGFDHEPDLLCAASGVMSVAWHSDDSVGGLVGTDWDIFQCLAGTRAVSRPELLNTSGIGDDPGFVSTDHDESPAMAFAPDGTLHAVWESRAANLAGGTDWDIYHAARGPAGWSAPELVNASGALDTGNDNAPDIAIDAQGRLHVVWASDSNIGGASGTDRDIFYASRTTPGPWLAPELVNSSGTSDSGAHAGDMDPRIILRAGEPHVVWLSDYNHANFNNPLSNISHSRRGPAGWTPEVLVNAATAENPPADEDAMFDLAVDRDGLLHCVWASETNYGGAGADYDILHATWDGLSWSAPAFVNSATIDGAHDTMPAIAATPDGSLHAVWTSDLDLQGSGGDSDLFVATRSGGAWGPVSLLLQSATADGNAYDGYTRAGVDALGQLHVVWVSTFNLLNTAGGDFDLMYAIVNPTGALPSPAGTVLANPSGHADFADNEFQTDIAVSPVGRAHFAWQSTHDMGGVTGVDWDVYHTRSMAHVTLEDLIAHLLGVRTLMGERARLCDRNGDARLDAADVVHWVLVH